MKNANSDGMNVHVDELIEEVIDDPAINSNERHFLHKVRGRDHEDRRDMRKVLRIYTRSHFQQGR